MSEPTIWRAGENGPRFERVLVVVAHPDDCEAACAGTVRRLILGGSAVHLVVATSGDKGTTDPAMTPDRLVALREAEQRRAGERLGLASVTFLRYGDGELPETPALLGDLVRQIRRRQPDLVVSHDGVNVSPPYFCHRDHRALGRAVLDAVYPSARDTLYFPEHLRDEGLATWRVEEVWLFSTTVPDLFVDVSHTIEDRLAARLEHTTQVRDADALRERYLTRSASLGAPHGLAHAEAFKRVSLANR